MIIVYKPKVAHILTVPFRKTGTGKPIRANCKSSYRLIPGTNEVPDVVWDYMKEQETLQSKIKEGELSSISEVKEKAVKDKNGNMRQKKTEKAKELKDLDSIEAIKLIKDCNDLEILKGWKKKRGLNDELRIEITNRIEAVQYFIKTGKEKKE